MEGDCGPTLRNWEELRTADKTRETFLSTGTSGYEIEQSRKTISLSQHIDASKKNEGVEDNTMHCKF